MMIKIEQVGDLKLKFGEGLSWDEQLNILSIVPSNGSIVEGKRKSFTWNAFLLALDRLGVAKLLLTETQRQHPVWA